MSCFTYQSLFLTSTADHLIQVSGHIGCFKDSGLLVQKTGIALRKEWDYAIPEVYVIVLMDGFAMPGSDAGDRYLHDICLCNRGTGEVFYDVSIEAYEHVG